MSTFADNSTNSSRLSMFGRTANNPNNIPPYVPNTPITTSTGIIPIGNGNFITAFRTTDEEGNLLKIIYEPGKEVTGGTYFPQCLGPKKGLYQEGVDWSVITTSKIKGFSVKWKMPDGTINHGNGIFYNPVNFFVDRSDPHQYSFFQVSYGVGDILNPREGWTMTYSNHPLYTASRSYPSLQLTSVPISPGTEYTIDAGLEAAGQSSASENVYVVQITVGGDSWIYPHVLGYDPSSSSAKLLSSFQDEYILQGPVSSDLTSDTVSSPQIITQLVNESPHLSNTAIITSKIKPPFPNTQTLSSSTWNILTPNSQGSNVIQNDLCSPLPIPEFSTQNVVLIASIIGLISFGFMFKKISSFRI